MRFHQDHLRNKELSDFSAAFHAFRAFGKKNSCFPMGQKKRGSAHSFLLMLLLLASIFSGSRGSSSPRSSSLMIGHGNGCFVCQYTRATKRRERGKKLSKSRSDRTSISSSPSPTWSSFFCAPCPPPVDESMFTSRNQWL